MYQSRSQHAGKRSCEKEQELSNLNLPKSIVWYVNMPVLKKTRKRLSLDMMLYYVKVTVLHECIEFALASIKKLMKPLVNLTLLTFVPTV